MATYLASGPHVVLGMCWELCWCGSWNEMLVCRHDSFLLYISFAAYLGRCSFLDEFQLFAMLCASLRRSSALLPLISYCNIFQLFHA